MKYADLIAKLTLEEKAGLTSGLDFWHTKAVERLGIPSEMMTDGPHGLRKQESDCKQLGRDAALRRWPRAWRGGRGAGHRHGARAGREHQAQPALRAEL